jgi:hypothetical protein
VRISISTSSLALLMLLAGGGAAQNRPAPAAPAAPVSAPPAATTRTTAASPEMLLEILPPSDLIAVVDLHQMLKDLQPRLEKIGIAGAAKLATNLRQIAARSGVDPDQIRYGLLGLSLHSFEASGVMLIDGIDPARNSIEAMLKSYQIEFSAADYEGVTMITILTKLNPLELGPFSFKTEDLSIALLGRQRLAIGDTAGVRKLIDGQKTEKRNAGPENVMNAALRETSPSALLRFAFTLPPGLRQEALNQGDLFKSIGSIKVLIGDLNAGQDLTLTLNSIMRTPTPAAATELLIGLRGLLTLGRALLAGNPQFTPLLDRIQIRSSAADVSLNITLPPSFLEQMGKTSN